ncbi:MAG TPA: hypothetical protein VK563_15890 [Puia sp.]|nr:hypothetical protein [Puia sp.]
MKKAIPAALSTLSILLLFIHSFGQTPPDNLVFDYTSTFSGGTSSQQVERTVLNGHPFTFSVINLPADVNSVSGSVLYDFNGRNGLAISGNLAVAAHMATCNRMFVLDTATSGFTVTLIFSNSNVIIIHFTTGNPSPNFFVGSFIKSIAGIKVNSELLDILFKVNLTDRRRMYGRHFSFALIGADAGLSSSDSSNSIPLRLNEAVVSLNYSLNRIHPWTMRAGFIGGGLKVFNGNAYVGGHVGIMEINGIFQGSYLMAGYYYSPWLTGVKTDSIPYNYYRQNLYFESAFNAFGENAPKALQSIRLKFGLLLPVASAKKDASGNLVSGDAVRPTAKDFMYRLAVEVPIGGPIKF